MHSDKKLYLVFEYLDLDLKKHMDSHPNFGTDHSLVKVSACARRSLVWVAMCTGPLKGLCFAVLPIPDASRHCVLSFSSVSYAALAS